MLIGLHTRILDTMNQLPMPAEFGNQFTEGLYITQGFDRNVMLLTKSAFEKVYERVTSLNLADPLARILLRMILGTAYQTKVEPDGFISIPGMLKEFAQLSDEVILVGLGDYVEVWSPEFWTRQVEQLVNADVNVSRFSSLIISTR